MKSQCHFRHHLTVEQVDNPASIARIVLRVGHHHNGSAFLTFRSLNPNYR